MPKDLPANYPDIPGIITVALDRAGKVTYISNNGCKLLGYGQKAVIGKNWFDMFVPDPKAKKTFKAFVSGRIKAPVNLKNEVKTADGKLRLFLWNSILVKAGKGVIKGVLSSGTDITFTKAAAGRLLLEKKHAHGVVIARNTKAIKNYTARGIIRRHEADSRKKSEEMFRTVADYTYDWEYWTDMAGNFKYCSPSCDRVTGYTADEFMKNPGLLRDIVHPDNLEVYDTYLQASFDTTEVGELDLKIIRKDGREAWISHNCVNVFDSEGNPSGRRSSDREITERVMVEKFLEESERKFREVFNGSNDAILLHTVNPDGTFGQFMEVNDTACKRLGYTKQEFYLLTPADIDASEMTAERLAAIESINRTGSATFETLHLAKGGSKIPVEVNAKIIEMGGQKAVLSVARNITERKIAETVLKESEKQYRTLFENMKSAFAYHRLLINSEGRPYDYEFIEVNAAFEELTGWKRGDIVGKTVLEVDPDTFKREFNWLDIYQKVAITGKPVKFEAYEGRTKKWFAVSAYSNRIMHFAVVFDDITESKLAQEQIRKLSVAVEQSANTVIITDTEGRIEYANKKFEETTGYTVKEALGDNPRILKSGHFGKETYDILWNTIKSGHDWRGEFYNKRKDGTLYWEAATISPIKDEKGVITNFIAIKEDITKRKETEDRLLETSASLQDFFDNANDIIQIVRPDITFEYVNKKWLDTLGYTAKEASELMFFDIIREDHRQGCREIFNGLISGTPVNYLETVFVTKGGKEITVEGNVNCLISNGKILHTRAIFRDVTEKRRAEEELKESIRKLRELDVLKSNFTAMISHELRTPLTAIKGFTSFLIGGVSGKLNESQKEYAEIIKSNSDRLLKLINEILDISKIESGTFSITKDNFNLIEVVSKALDDIGPVAARKYIEVVREMPGRPVNAVFDSYRIAQVIINLLNNSIKFSKDNSRIFVGIEPEAKQMPFVPDYAGKTPAPGIRYVEFYVRDEGVGIDKQNLSKIFDRFYQVSDDDQRIFNGVGLGLNITQGIVEAHGGIVWVESEGKGKGSCFRVILPEV